jgi:guanine nucleotide-binding protein G(I)/G(S)/G(T) subunit beta-1
MTDLGPRLKAAKDKLAALTAEIAELRKSKLNGSLPKSASASANSGKVENARQLLCVRTFAGHNDNVTSVSWSSHETTFASAGKDGQLIVWNGATRRQIQVIKHNTQWLMCCAYEPRENRLIATGGADQVCSLFVVGQIGMTHPSAELRGHEGYLSSCKFINNTTIVTTSGDSTAKLWDISRGQSTHSFTEHAADCLTVSVHPTEENRFVTGSADCTAKIWDVRGQKCTHTFAGHESDVNTVAFFPDGYAIGTASTDSTCRIYDTRCCGQVACFELRDSQVPASSGTTRQ